MRPILLDTNAALWILDDSPRLGRQARAAIAERAGNVLVSVASVWETAIKQSIAKLAVDGDLWAEAERSGLRFVDITRADAEGVRDLPLHHRDPFDRLVVAQARRRGAEIVTSDAHIVRYEVDVIDAQR